MTQNKMKRKLQLAVDADDVLVNFSESLVEQYNKKYNKNKTVEELITEWDLNKNVEEGEDMYEIMDSPGMFSNLTPYKDAVAILNELISDGHEIIISTAASRSFHKEKYDNFNKYFPFIPEEQILMIKRKDLLHLDVMIDDGPHNIVASNCKLVIIMDRPWNRHLNGYRVNSLTEAYNIINDYSLDKDIQKYWKQAPNPTY